MSLRPWQLPQLLSLQQVKAERIAQSIERERTGWHAVNKHILIHADISKIKRWNRGETFLKHVHIYFPLSLSNLLSHSLLFYQCLSPFQFYHLNGVTYTAVKKGFVSMSPSAKQTYQTPLKSQLQTLTFVKCALKWVKDLSISQKYHGLPQT